MKKIKFSVAVISDPPEWFLKNKFSIINVFDYKKAVLCFSLDFNKTHKKLIKEFKEKCVDFVNLISNKNYYSVEKILCKTSDEILIRQDRLAVGLSVRVEKIDSIAGKIK